MESKFKVGDKVTCINNECSDLLKGDVYTVKSCDEAYVVIKDSTGFCSGIFCIERFRLFSAIPEPTTKLSLPSDSKARKDIPMARGCMDYFPAALAAVAAVSKAGNDKHNPGQEMHHARGKSNDHADCILRHLMDRGTVDPEDNLRHSAKVAWRALALLQEELEAAGAPLARGAKVSE